MAPILSRLPRTQKAIIAGNDLDFLISSDVPVAELDPELILIKNVAVALNPVDTKLVGDFVTPGVTFGFDCAGVVVAIGSAVKRNIKPGDRVCGSADGMNRDRPSGGAFAEYVTLHGELALKIPASMSFEEASALGTAIASGCMALFSSLKIPASLTSPPKEEPFHVLVYGGSSTTGTMAIQLIKTYELSFARFLFSPVRLRLQIR
jgi:NADPH:quinone reductase-like Zn-dependent oxidoreductase